MSADLPDHLKSSEHLKDRVENILQIMVDSHARAAAEAQHWRRLAQKAEARVAELEAQLAAGGAA